LLVDLD